MPGQLPGPVKKARAAQLITLGERLSGAFHARYHGATRPVLWEMATGAEPEGLRWVGYSDNYIRVSTVGPADLMNRVTPARLSGPRADGMTGAIEGSLGRHEQDE
jgi:threonylcarbamoyladenosine tRNA methylthiotransferase MtaB